MILPVTVYGHSVLREKGALIAETTDEIRTLADNMIDTMRAADGIGLAAQQIGSALQLAVIDLTGAQETISYLKVNGEEAPIDSIMPLIFTNPVIEALPSREVDEEGCLSFPEIKARVTRPSEIKATMRLLDGSELIIETDGLLARAIQHETDHLNGVLFIDRLPSAAKLGLKRKIRRMQDRYGTLIEYRERDAEEEGESV